MVQNNNNTYHVPVLLNEAVEMLVVDNRGVYVDVTFGGGGHSSEILSRLDMGAKLVAFDQDSDALANVLDDDRFVFVPQNFAYVKNNLRLHRLMPVDGLLADLGVSSHQFDTAERGFSFRFEGDLDMRMDKNASLDAKKVLNEYDEVQLFEMFKLYGELKNARAIASRVVYKRASQPFRQIEDLKSALYNLAPKLKQNQFFAQVFQAIRIEVNQELTDLEILLTDTAEILKHGGRLSVISYHSLEDRLVKNFLQTGNTEGNLEKDFFGNSITPFTSEFKKPLIPGESEINDNPRSRSAKLRIGIKK
jgi:16S rRNA (cytosine1402-N4)-methyltransferase